MSAPEEEHHFDEDIQELHQEAEALEELDGSPSRRGKKKRDSATLRKAPQAPKRFKSSYICFFMAKQPEIKAELGEDANVTSISKRSAEMWKHLPPEERAHWDDVAARDKQRFMIEKATYTGPWQVPWKRVKKDPSAPRRPMSAFLFYSLGKRQQIKTDNPEMKNTEVSRVLGEMWRSLSDEERLPFVEREKEEREKYKLAIAEWRQEMEAKKESQRGFPPSPACIIVPQENHSRYPDPYVARAVPPQIRHASAHPYLGTACAPPGLYPFPTNGKQPVILGPNGMPHFRPGTTASQTSQPPPRYREVVPNPPHTITTNSTESLNYDDNGPPDSSAIQNAGLDYHADHLAGESTM